MNATCVVYQQADMLEFKQSAGSIPTMKIKTLFAILTCVHLSLVQSLDQNATNENGVIDSNRRVVNGEDADPADFPFLVRLHKETKLCGGSIISNFFILTAAHCVNGTECSKIKIFASTWAPGSEERFHSAECHPHEEYPGAFLYDIALIRTVEDMLADENFKAIPLPPTGITYATSTNAVVVGWGRMADGSHPGRILRANVLIEDWDTCNYKFKHAHQMCISDTDCDVLDIPRRGICTQGFGPKPSGICHGDSGGPLIVDGTIAGEATGAILLNGKCEAGTPSLFTRVVDYLPWIYSFIEPDKDTSKFYVVEETS